MSDPAGPSPRIALPSVFDMHPDDPRRHASLLIVSAVERVAHEASLLVSERMIPIMSALQDLASAVQEEADTIAVAVQQIANHSAVRSDGELTSLAARIRNSTQTLKDAMSQAATADQAGAAATDQAAKDAMTSGSLGLSPEGQSTVPGGGTETSDADKANADAAAAATSATDTTSSGGPSTSRRR